MTAMAGLQLQERNQQNLINQKQAQAQQQHQQHQQRQQQAPAPVARMAEDPIPAPMPQRPNNGVNAPPVVNAVQSPVGVPGTTTWQEGMPIVFGGGQQAGAGAAGKQGQGGQPVDGRWDAGKGLRFG
jgi:programmed cell death 6-interacting protein